MTETLKLIARLEARIAELEDQSNFRWEQVKKNLQIVDENSAKDAKIGKRGDEILFGMIEHHEKWIKSLVETVESLRRQTLRYDEAYYQVFPERLAKDIGPERKQESEH